MACEHEAASSQYLQLDESNRVVGGLVASEGSIPYMVALRTGIFIRFFICGGSIITTRHVLTAAHCIDSVYRRGSLSISLRVAVGTNRWNIGGRSFSVVRNITHENWNSLTVKNDIGILVTGDIMPLNDRIQPVTLNYDYVIGDVTSLVAGWGRTVVGGPLSNRLLVLFVTAVEGDECSKAMNYDISVAEQFAKYDTELELCAFSTRGQGVCNGDSGSALVRKDSNEQIGIVSWGYACARGVPDVYVRLSAYKEWIENALSVPS
ncbi:chymotrypsin-2-like [Vanessa cardui]|uniref:chymotrypsin-2-like n=1 Tax=Vanessa cardui TaxID=171605 RepID=UPI001F12F943|nr:chymotrypsin-2-like [Vanessa cardui]